ncbi:hypothetical protein MASR2M29_04590 [Spirochaetota bacterium]
MPFFDSPVAHSAKHAASFSAILSELGMKANAILARDPDAVLKKAPTGTVVASSDSIILDALAEQSHIVIFDAARATLDTFKKQKTGASEAWFDLASLV